MTRPFFKQLTKACSLIVLLCIVVDNNAWAESPYPRDQVERHLRHMFKDSDRTVEMLEMHLPNGNLAKYTNGFDFFTSKKQVRLGFFDLKDQEQGTISSIVIELFDEILKQPVVPAKPYEGEVDLLVYVSDDLAKDALTPKYKSTLKRNGTSEEAYLKEIQELSKSNFNLWVVKYARPLGETVDVLSVAAVERLKPEMARQVSFATYIRFTLFAAMTGGMWSSEIRPSVMNPPDEMQSIDSYAPIDRAVLRAIFNHHDWFGKDYETKIKLLTDRVMQELNKMR